MLPEVPYPRLRRFNKDTGITVYLLQCSCISWLGRPSLRQKSAQFLTHGSRPVQLPTRRPGSHSNKGTSNKGAQLQLEICPSAKAPATARRSAGGLVDTASMPLHLPLALRLHASTLGAMFPLAVLEHLRKWYHPMHSSRMTRQYNRGRQRTNRAQCAWFGLLAGSRFGRCSMLREGQ